MKKEIPPRKIKIRNTGYKRIYVGHSSAVSIYNGYEIAPGESLYIELKTKSPIWAISEVDTKQEIATDPSSKETCQFCGQKIDRAVWLKHTKKFLKKQGLPSLARALEIVNKK